MSATKTKKVKAPKKAAKPKKEPKAKKRDGKLSALVRAVNPCLSRPRTRSPRARRHHRRLATVRSW
jgi:hypothetical protein